MPSLHCSPNRSRCKTCERTVSGPERPLYEDFARSPRLRTSSDSEQSGSLPTCLGDLLYRTEQSPSVKFRRASLNRKSDRRAVLAHSHSLRPAVHSRIRSGAEKTSKGASRCHPQARADGEVFPGRKRGSHRPTRFGRRVILTKSNSPDTS